MTLQVTMTVTKQRNVHIIEIVQPRRLSFLLIDITLLTCIHLSLHPSEANEGENTVEHDHPDENERTSPYSDVVEPHLFDNLFATGEWAYSSIGFKLC